MLLIPTRLSIIVCSHMVPYYDKGIRMSMPEITERFNVNPRTLNPALRALVHAGILNSKTGGTDRGYILARDPRQISLYDIIKIIQGEPKAECCMHTIGSTNCEIAKCEDGNCKVFNTLNSVMEYTRTVIGSISLYDQYYNKQSGLKTL